TQFSDTTITIHNGIRTSWNPDGIPLCPDFRTESYSFNVKNSMRENEHSKGENEHKNR
ncbi:hypothetical protein NPIL_627611, partial [Nephila pilipes]